MPHAIYRVLSFEIIGAYQLRVRFDDGVSREIDFQPILIGPLFGPLKQLNLFNQVTLDPEIQTLVWPNGADFDPATLHDWPIFVSRLTQMLSHSTDSTESDLPLQLV